MREIKALLEYNTLGLSWRNTGFASASCGRRERQNSSKPTFHDVKLFFKTLANAHGP